MPDKFNDRFITQDKPARISSDKPAINETPSAKGAPVGGTDFTRGDRRNLSTADSRPQVSSPTRVPGGVAAFDPDCT